MRLFDGRAATPQLNAWEAELPDLDVFDALELILGTVNESRWPQAAQSYLDRSLRTLYRRGHRLAIRRASLYDPRAHWQAWRRRLPVRFFLAKGTRDAADLPFVKSEVLPGADSLDSQGRATAK